MTGLFLAVFFPLFALYLHTLSPTVPLEDGGEFIRAAWCLGVAHPPGYPLYTLLGRLFLLVPAGDPAFRMNLLSAVCGASACAVVALVAARLAVEPGGKWARFSAWSAALLLGTGFTAWWQSSIAEKYSLNLLLAALCAAALLAAMRGGVPPVRRAVLLALSYGAWLAHHGQAVYFLPAVGLVWWRIFRDHPEARRNTVLYSIAALAIALSPKLLYTAVRAAAHPLHNWNDPSVLGRFAGYSIGDVYQWRSFFWGPLDSLGRLAGQLYTFFPHQFGWPGVALGIGGAALFFRRRRPEALPWLLAAAAGTVFCASFFQEGSAAETYYLPVFLVFTLFVSAGLGWLPDLLGRNYRLAAAAVAAWLAVHAVTMRQETDRSRHYFANDFSVNVLSGISPGAILVAHTDYDIFPLWYVHDVLGRAPGVLVVDANYLTPGLVGGPLAGQVELVYPPGAEDIARAYPFAAGFLRIPPARPVFFSVVFRGVERYPLTPVGAAYRLETGGRPEGVREIAADRARFRRWRRVRGIFSPDIRKDGHTQRLLAGYSRLDYQAGLALAERGEYRAAESAYRRALGWPEFESSDPAALHGSIGWCREKAGDIAGALEEYREAVRRAPGRAGLLKMLGALYGKAGRNGEALEAYRRAASLDRTDMEARRKVLQLQQVVPGG